MGKLLLCMALFLAFRLTPRPLRHGADNRLPARLHGDVLDPHHLLALAAVPIQGLAQRREGAHQLVGLV
jgi:hypothetical protein